MNKVTIVYDDTRKPAKDIASITGKKSFGETIFKRKTLRERVYAIFEEMPEVERVVDASAKEILSLNGAYPILLFYSDFGIVDGKLLQKLVYKACFAHEEYTVLCSDRIAGVIFTDAESFRKASIAKFDTYTRILSEGLVDLADITNFRTFITSGFEARFFNSLSGDDYTLVKSSDNPDKLKAEYLYYGLLPENMKQWFVRPFDFKSDGGRASYKMQRYHMTDLAIRYIHGSISEEEFRDIMAILFHFIGTRQRIDVSEAEYEAEAEKLYVKKVSDRLDMLKESEGYSQIAELVKNSTSFGSLDEIFEDYKKLYKKIRENKKFDHIKVIGHGDLCFSNILYSHDASLLLLIDPKGATVQEEMFMDPYYDLAKLSHSVCGHYDFFNSDLYEIEFDENLKTGILVDADNRKYVEIFKEYLSSSGIDFRLIRLYEASLFLSMLPLHMDRPKKVFAFILNAVAILNTLKE